MRILFDIGHPFHVHFFRPTIDLLKKRGADIHIVARDKDMTRSLLDSFGFTYVNKGVGGSGVLDRVEYTFRSLSVLQNSISSFRPDLCLSVASPYLAFLCRAHNIRHIMFNDTEGEFLFKQIVSLFKPELYLPDSFHKITGIDFTSLPSYLELAYLHPDVFTPDDTILEKTGRNYILVRFVANNAAHDFGNEGFTDDEKRKIVQKLSRENNVWISSEEPLPADLKKHELEIGPGKIHDAIAHADLVFGGSATMSSEAAMLGVPSVLISHNQWGYIRELSSKYQLVHYYENNRKSREAAFEKAVSILNRVDGKKIYEKKRLKMLKDKQNLTNIMMNIIVNGTGPSSSVHS